MHRFGRLYRTTTVLSLMSKVTDLREVGIGVSLCGSLEETDLYFCWKRLSYSCHSPDPVKHMLLSQTCFCQKLNPEPRSKDMKQLLLFNDTKEVLLLPQSSSCQSPVPAKVLLLPKSCQSLRPETDPPLTVLLLRPYFYKPTPVSDMLPPQTCFCHNPAQLCFCYILHRRSSAPVTVQLLPDSCSWNKPAIVFALTQFC
ncbi:hypothetical protein WMY93_029142 [Mugilogobius chulae]|uniref:Uncharacterized protein n=1 Tax=Mugilogobius chulae TaxID=88201 RepID=A0AAW0MQG9_9GOBI